MVITSNVYFLLAYYSEPFRTGGFAIGCACQIIGSVVGSLAMYFEVLGALFIACLFVGFGQVQFTLSISGGHYETLIFPSIVILSDRVSDSFIDLVLSK
jgi:hypothetical protein